jgi:hypothetical protein
MLFTRLTRIFVALLISYAQQVRIPGPGGAAPAAAGNPTLAAPSTCFQLGANGGTTTGINLTGLGTITHISIGVFAYSLGTIPPTVSDSGSNTLTGRTAISSSEPWVRVYDVQNPTVSSSYTVTATGAGSFIAVCIVAQVGGTGAYDTTAGQLSGTQNSSAGTSVSAGPLTPTNNNEMLVTFLCYSAANSPTPGAGWTQVGSKADYSGGNNEGGIAYYQIQTTATAATASWTWSTGTRGVTTLNAYQ